MYALIKGQQLIGIFTSKKLMRETCKILIDDDYIETSTYGWGMYIFDIEYYNIDNNVL